MNSTRTLTLAWLLTAGCIGCGDADSEQPVSHDQDTSFSVITSNAPLGYFARSIGGDLITVATLAPDGVDPADWEPGAEAVLRIQAADLLVINGAGYEPWLGRVSVPSTKVVDASAMIGEHFIKAEGVTHQHGPEGEHSHGAVAFTLWLDPILAIEQTRAIRAALVHRLPSREADLDAGFEALEQSLRALDGRWQAVTEALGGQPVLFSHPVYQYLERRYGINGRSLHWEPHTSPTEADWRAFGDLLRAHPAQLMIWEQAPLDAVRLRLEEAGLEIAVVDPRGTSATGVSDYLQKQNAAIDDLLRQIP